MLLIQDDLLDAPQELAQSSSFRESGGHVSCPQPGLQRADCLPDLYNDLVAELDGYSMNMGGLVELSAFMIGR